MDLVTCSRCGAGFVASGGPGRPRSKCDRCRSNHDKIGGTQWNVTRAVVLARDPICRWPGCTQRSVQVDHIIPLEHGGYPYALDNLQGLCAHHNASKGARLPDELPPLKRLPVAYLEFFAPVECEYHYPKQLGPGCPHHVEGECPPEHFTSA